jgi:hypothetical protein
VRKTIVPLFADSGYYNAIAQRMNQDGINSYKQQQDGT